ncbi:hypothetical protein F4778DRAFT_731406 [Xylariomycetidae sp. FL2044]|nr:hypothetical protein F4778DRAFT_731406 [Xylariomycetidae sp. FL2044]
MHAITTLVLAAGLAGFASAGAVAPGNNAEIIIQTFSGTTSSNKTVAVPIGTPYSDSGNLAKVSTLFLNGASGVPVESVTCKTFRSTDGTGTPAGNPFTSSSPARLSTNTVEVGSIVCQSTASSSMSSSSSGSPSTTAASPSGTASGSASGSETGSTSTGSDSTGSGSDGTTSSSGSGSGTTTDPSSSSPQVEIGAASSVGASMPYLVSALFIGAAGLVFGL